MHHLDDIRRRIFVAIDTPTLAEALPLMHALHGHVGGFKVGLELCTGVGVPQVIAAVSTFSNALFLDLKFKDIPNTVAGAARALVHTGGSHVHMFTVHCDGGSAMLRAAVTTARDVCYQYNTAPPLVLGVTVLTSMDEATLHGEIGVPDSVGGHVVRLARLAQSAGLDGVIASPHEVAAIRQACGSDFLIVTPGVRPRWASTDDQTRIMTPAQALQAGADYLVIGRPITAAQAEDGGPAGAADRIVKELADERA
jgi:orotidine-5'-phosphate decarboxylase